MGLPWAVRWCALSAAALAEAAADAVDRPLLGRTLVEDLFVGKEPFAKSPDEDALAHQPEHSITHVSSRDIDMVLEFAPQPVNFWVELGAYEGGSAILTARRAEKRAVDKGLGRSVTTVLAVDTFLGDLYTLWGRSREERMSLIRDDGSVSLYDRFRANVWNSGFKSSILPMPATSVVALKLLVSLVHRGVAPRPQVIYLDSAHEEGEVLLELGLAWEAVAPGGIVFGDDWILGAKAHGEKPTKGEGVQRDVLRFAEARVAELDDDFGPRVQPMRTLGRARPGLFVSYLSFQWFMRKHPDAAQRAATQAAVSSLQAESDASVVGYDCWSDGYDGTDCCDVAKHGPEGDLTCWDIVFTFHQCCPGATT